MAMKETVDFLFGIALGVGLGILICLFLTDLQIDPFGPTKSYKPIAPTVEVHCIDNVCDTIYIYNHPEKE